MNIGFLVETPITKEKKMYGAQISFLNLLKELLPLGVTPYVVVSEEWELTDKLKELGISVLITPIYEFFTSVDGAYGEYHDSEKQKKQNALSYKAMKEYFEKNNVELVHMNTRFCGLLGANVAIDMNIPYIFHIREFLKEDFGLVFKDEALADRIIGNSNSLIAISKSIKSYLSTLYLSTRIELIYNGLVLEKYSHPECQRLNNNIIKLAIVGRVISHKGQLEAIKAVEHVVNVAGYKHILLKVVGIRPDEMTEYENMLVDYVTTRNLSDYVEFVPFTDNVEDVLSDCDIGLTCSKMEAFGRVTVEYMLSHLLAIGANSGGTPEVIDDTISGLLYNEGDYLSLANSILWAIKNPIDANRIITNGHRKAVTNYTSKKNASEIFALYKDILHK